MTSTTYAQGRPILDADSHLMELPGFLDAFIEEGMIDRLKGRSMEALTRVLDDATAKASARSADDAARQAAEERLLLDKGWHAMGAFDPSERSHVVDMFGFDGQLVFATFAGVYFWFPKMTGRLLDERLGKVHFWLTLIGFHTTFLVQHWLGDEGMPRRYADYLPSDGFQGLNIVSTIGAFILGASMLPFIWNVFRSWRYGEPVMVDDPWGYGNSLEWATSCPPPRHNFYELPRIRSERPAFELHYPHMIERMRAEAHIGRHATAMESPEGFGPRTEPDR